MIRPSSRSKIGAAPRVLMSSGHHQPGDTETENVSARPLRSRHADDNSRYLTELRFGFEGGFSPTAWRCRATPAAVDRTTLQQHYVRGAIALPNAAG